MKNTTAVILLLISAGLFYTVVLPQYQKVLVHRQEAAQYKDILTNVSDLSAKRDELLVQYQAMPKDQVDRLNKVLPDSVDLVKLATDFDSIASKYNVSISGIQTVDMSAQDNSSSIQMTSDQPYNSTNVSITFIASYENFRKFMADIEQSLRIIDVKAISFVPGENDLYQYKVSIETYWLK